METNSALVHRGPRDWQVHRDRFVGGRSRRDVNLRGVQSGGLRCGQIERSFECVLPLLVKAHKAHVLKHSERLSASSRGHLVGDAACHLLQWNPTRNLSEELRSSRIP